MADKNTKQKNNDYHRYLTDEQFDQLEKYKHFAPKTSYENNLIWFTGYIERVLPQSWTANVVTVIGNVTMFTCTIMAIYYGGLNHHDPTNFLPRWLFIYAAFCVQWFSWWDCMDGQRARRLKCGTPIGRVLDEAGDMVQYTFFTVMLGYVCKVGPGWNTLGYNLINLAMYSMEVHYLITSDLTINLDLVEFGPVELELMIALILLACGIFGNEGMIVPVSKSYPSMSAIFSESITWGHCLNVFFLLIISIAVAESLEKCTHKYGHSYIYYMIAPLLIWINGYAGAFLETQLFMEYQVLYNILYQMIQNIQIFRLMMSNMAKIDYQIIGVENLFGLIPIIVHLACGQDKALQNYYEPVTSIVCIGVLFVHFYWYHMAGLITQYYRRNPHKSFWVITDSPDQDQTQGKKQK